MLYYGEADAKARHMLIHQLMQVISVPNWPGQYTMTLSLVAPQADSQLLADKIGLEYR